VGEDIEAGRWDFDPVSVRHPDLMVAWREERVLSRDIDLGRSIFSLGGRSDLSTQCMCQRLHPITDSKDGETTREDICGDLRCTRFIYGGWSSREDETKRFEGENFLFRRIV